MAGEEAKAGKPIKFKIVARDIYGNQRWKGGDTFDVSVNLDADMKMEDNKDGTYR